jgi:hypothetical protein
MDKRTLLILIGSLACLALAAYSGLTAHGTLDRGYHGDLPYTDWGRVALTLVFGASGALGLWHCLRKSS